MGIQGCELLSGADFQPVLQIPGLAIVQGVDQEHGQGEIINIISLLLNLFLHGIMLVNLRQNRHIPGLHDFRTLIQQLPHIRLDEKAAGSRLLCGIGEGVQTDHGRAMAAHAGKVVPDEPFRRFGLAVDVDLLLVKGTPDLLRGAVRKMGLHIGSARLSFINHIHLLFGGFSALPEILIADEQILPRGSVLLFQKILIIFAVGRDVIDHVVKHQIIFVRQPLHVLPVPEGRIHLRVVHGCKAPVSRRREKGKDVDAAHRILKVRGKDFLQLLQIVSHGIGIGDQHDFVFQLFHRFLLLFLYFYPEFLFRRTAIHKPYRKDDAGFDRFLFNQFQQHVRAGNRHLLNRLLDTGDHIVSHIQNSQAIVADQLYLPGNAYAQLSQLFQDDSRMDVGAGEDPVIFAPAVSDDLLQESMNPADALLLQGGFLSKIHGFCR